MSLGMIFVLCLAIAVVAFLYSSVGHAGASGYIAVLTLLGLELAVVKPAALVLNILVACLTTWQFYRAGYFSWALFWPFALLSVPCAFVGGYLNLPAHIFKVLVGLILLYSATRFFFSPKQSVPEQANPPTKPIALGVGAGLGLLSGLTGTGGGIFLTPLMILLGWAETKAVAAVSAPFILLNSLSGLLGNMAATRQLPLFTLPLLAAAGVGGALGSYLGSQRFSVTLIKRLLALVLLIAGVKLLFT